MKVLGWFSRRKWAWQPGSGPPPPTVIHAAASVLQRAGTKAAAEREAVLRQLAVLVDPSSQQQGKERAAAMAAALACPQLLDAVSKAVQPESRPSEVAVEAAATLAAHMAAASAAAAAALACSPLVGSLVSLLAAPSTQVSPDAKLDVLAFVREAAPRAHIRDAMHEEGAAAAVVSTLRGATQVCDWPLAGEAAWALEMMAAWSRRLTTDIGEAGGLEALVGLLQAARRQQPAMRELPREEEAAEAADSALHALLVLAADNRRNRVRLQQAGGASELVAAFRDERLGWESREQAATLLQDMAATLDVAAEEPLLASTADAGRPLAGAGRPREAAWRDNVLPPLVAVLQQRRGVALQESKEAAAEVLAKFSAHGPRFAAEVGEAGALPPLLQLLQAGMQLAGGQRQPAIAALRALEPLVGEQKCREQLAGACVSGSGQLDLLGLLWRLLVAATDPALSLSDYSLTSGAGAAAASGSRGGAALAGQVVAAGWHAALVTARLCGGEQQELQDAAVERGLLPLLAAFVQAEPPPAPPALPGSLAVRGPEAAGGGSAADFMTAVRCEVAGLLRSISRRAVHHPALRSCPGLVAYLSRLLLPGAPGWTELKVAAKKILQNLGDLPNTDRPLLTYTSQQLRALLEQHGIQAGPFVERNVSGADFVRLTDGELRTLVAPSQQARVLRVLRAFETFSEIDGCGTRSGSFGLAKMVSWLGNRGYRQGEVVVLGEALLELMDGDRDDAVTFPDFLQCYDEFLARTMADLQPPSKRRRTESFLL